MDPAAAPPAWSASDAERAWKSLIQIVRFGDRLDFVFLECASPEVRDLWRRALRAYCEERGQPWTEVAAGETILDWLERERLRGEGIERAGEPMRQRSVYFGAIPQDDRERFVFARINENRDKLVAALDGVLCLGGEGDFVRRLAYAAPSIWAMRTRSLELRGPPPEGVPLSKDTVSEPAPSPLRQAEAFDLDVLISAAPHDEKEARDLAMRLTNEGFRVAVGLDDPGHAPAPRARLLVPLVSRSYAFSEAWEALERQLAADELAGVSGKREALRARLVPVLLSDGPLPGALRGMTPLGFRTEAERAHEVPRLVRALRGEREAGTGPGLTAPVWRSDEKLSLDEPRLDFSRSPVQRLLELLSDAYADRDSMKLIARRAGLPLHRVNLDQPTSMAWANILDTAAAQGRLRNLLDAVLSDQHVAAHHDALRQLLPA